MRARIDSDKMLRESGCEFAARAAGCGFAARRPLVKRFPSIFTLCG